MKRTMIAVVALVLFTVISLASSSGAAAQGKGCPPHNTNTIIGSPGPDHLVGTACADVIYGRGGNDVLIGRGGKDRLNGGDGRDRLRAADGYADVVNGGPGFDHCRGDQLDVFRRCEVVIVFFVTPAK